MALMSMLRWCGAALLAMSTPTLATSLAADVFQHPQGAPQAQAQLRAAMPELGRVEVLRGRYQQRKFLREIPRPLLSSGEFLLVRGRGLWWHTQAPLDSELILRSPASRTASGGMRPGSGGEDAAASLFMALFALDLETLARSFELYLLPGGSSAQAPWQLGLRPREGALAAWLQQATLSGARQVEQLTLSEASGDRTEITLDAVAQPLSSLTPAERQRLGD
jgi:hypothetical protein